MTPVYSKRFVWEQGVSTLTFWPGPDEGKIWVIRQMDAYCNTGSASSSGLAGIANETEEIYVTLWAAKFAAVSYGSDSWSGRQVMYPGESIFFNVDSHATDFTCSGYELTASS